MMRPGAGEGGTEGEGEHSRKVKMCRKMRLLWVEIRNWLTVLLSLNNIFNFLNILQRTPGTPEAAPLNPGLVVCH